MARTVKKKETTHMDRASAEADKKERLRATDFVRLILDQTQVIGGFMLHALPEVYSQSNSEDSRRISLFLSNVATLIYAQAEEQAARKREREQWQASKPA